MAEERDLIDYAEEEAKETAICLWKFRQEHDSCSGCSTREFCDSLMERLQELEDEG